jgi:hypothetical protein
LLPNCEDAKIFNFNAGMQNQKLNIYCTLIWVPLYLSFWQCRIIIPNKTGFTFFSWEKSFRIQNPNHNPPRFDTIFKAGGLLQEPLFSSLSLQNLPGRPILLHKPAPPSRIQAGFQALAPPLALENRESTLDGQFTMPGIHLRWTVPNLQNVE